MHLFWLLCFINLGIDLNSLEKIKCLLNEGRALLGVREVGGNNRGPMVDKIIISSGGKVGQPWCGYTQKYIHTKCKCQSAGGMASSWFPKNRLVKIGQIAGDVFSIYDPYTKRIGHIGMIEQVLSSGNYYITIEGNTGGSGSRDGSGVHRLTRPKKTVYSIARWWTYEK
jgi:hypothetical protein